MVGAVWNQIGSDDLMLHLFSIAVHQYWHAEHDPHHTVEILLVGVGRKLVGFEVGHRRSKVGGFPDGLAILRNRSVLVSCLKRSDAACKAMSASASVANRIEHLNAWLHAVYLGLITHTRSDLTSQTWTHLVPKSRQQSNDFFQTPNVVCNSRLHRWRHTQGLVNTRKIVMHIMQGNRRFVILNLVVVRFEILFKILTLDLGCWFPYASEPLDFILH